VRKRPAALACLALGGVAVAVAVALATAGPEVTGCTTHQCDQSFYEWFPGAQALPDGGHVPGRGFMLDEDTYVTNDLNDPWLIYHGNTTVKIWFPPEVAGRTVEPPTVFAGTDDTPNSPESQEEGANFTQVDGQLATFTLLNTNLTYADGGLVGDGGVDAGAGGAIYGGSVLITNSSCASYFASVVVHFAHRDTPTAASTPAEGGAPTGAAAAGSD
jgi:hypothetical protein